MKRSANILTGTGHDVPPPWTPANIEIDTDVPFPAERAPVGGKWTPLLERMPVGGSCLVPAGVSGEAIRHASDSWAKREGNGAKFAVRKTAHGQRIWRIK